MENFTQAWFSEINKEQVEFFTEDFFFEYKKIINNDVPGGMRHKNKNIFIDRIDWIFVKRVDSK